MSSNLPGDTTPTLGLNGLIQGYPDQSYGEGLDQHGLSPGEGRSHGQNISDEPSDNGGPTSLPDGVVMAGLPENSINISFADTYNDNGGMGQLDDFFKEAAELTDLSWLDVPLGTEPERLPHNPVDTVIPELEESWTKFRGVPGIHFEPNLDPDRARYEASLQEPVNQEVPRQALATLVQDIMRMSAANPSWPIQTLIKTAKERVLREPEEVHAHLDKAAKAMKLIQDEHGLAGRVFIRAEAYPGYEQGHWTDYIRKTAGGARYILVDEGTMHSANVQSGYCTVTKKKAVRSIPWKAARKFYANLLAATGRQVDISGDAKTALKTAFNAKAADTPDLQGSRPVHVAPSQRVSSDEARERFDAYNPERQVISKKSREETANLKKAQVQVGRWVLDGLLSKEDGQRLLAAGLSGSEMIRLGALRITAAEEVHDYSGIFNQKPVYQVSKDQVQSHLAASSKAAKTRQGEVDQLRKDRVKATTRAAKKEAAIQSKVEKISSALDRGVKGSMLKKLIRTTFAKDEISMAAPLLDPLLKKAAVRVASSKKKTSEFSGPVYTRHAPMSKAAALTPSKKEVSKFLRWAKLKMNEGLSGRNLDTLIHVNWTDSIIKAASEPLQELRDAHEGLAGSLYVDATAYASRKGTDGCEKGALQHRTNGVKSVLAMDRCAGCVFAQKTADGTSVCSKYRKPLVQTREAALPGATPLSAKQATTQALRQFQHESVRLANASDEEQLASLFAPTYDPGEFGLHNAGMDEISFHDSPTEKLSGILWGDVPLNLDGE